MFRDIRFDTVTPGLESAIPYPMFYRRHGVRRAVQLVAPPLTKLSLLDLPRNSILHYAAEPEDESQYGLSQDDPLLSTQQRLIQVEHMTELGDDRGPPRSMHLPANQMIRAYHRANRQTRWCMRPEIALRDERTLIMENYAVLPHLFRYTSTFFSSYNKWWNIQARLWKRAGELTDTGRQQYVVCRLPAVLPSLGALKRAESGMSRPVLERLADTRSWMIVEIWKWLGQQRAESVLAKSTPKELANVNLLWLESGRWFAVNLGLIDEWRKPDKAELDAGAEDVGIITPEQMQRRFLRMLMVLSETRSADVSPVTQIDPDPATEPAATAEEAAAAVVAQNEEQSSTAPITIKVKDEDDKTRTIKLTSGMDADRLPEEESDETIAQIDAAITAELESADRFFEERHKAKQESEAGDGTVVEESDALVIERDPELVGTATVKYEADQRSFEKSLMAKVDALADEGLVSAAEYRRFAALSTKSAELPNPYGQGTLEEHSQVTPAELELSSEPQIPDITAVPDKSMLGSRLFDFDSKYIENVMSKDMAAMVLAIQHAGVAVTGYSVERFEDATGEFEIHKLQLTPVRGKPSTVEFRLPVVKSDGTFRSNGVRYRLRKQRADVPIRKVSPSRVALTSYYSKVFIQRSEKQTNNYPGWLTNQIAARYMDEADHSVTSLMVSRVFNPNTRVPRAYSILADRFRSFNAFDTEIFVDYKARLAHFGEERVLKAESGGKMVVCGRRNGRLLVMDWNNMIYQVNGDQLAEVGTIEQMLGFNDRRPIERAEIKVFGKLIPVGIFLGYQLGLTQLLELLGVKYRRVISGQRLNLAEDEFALRFSDESLILVQDGRSATLILSGLEQYEKWTRNYPIGLFDRKDIYLNILEHEKIGMRYLREMDLMVDLFIDPITEDILKQMNEPTSFIGLVLRACELLETDWSPAETDMAFQRIRGYERMSGAVYQELVKAIRMHRARGSFGAKIEVPPYAVWQKVHSDPAVKTVEESNPIHNLKESEEVTFGGDGGRGDRSMVGHTRQYHKNDEGVISEATKDSAQVAITTFLTANPNLIGLRGLTSRFDFEEDGAASVLSTSALLAPAADRDDPKRVNFISIQQSSGTFTVGYEPSPLRTGYEQVVAHRTDDMFAQTAKKAGKVISVSDKVISVEFEDGTQASYELGRRFGTVASMTLPHQLETTLKTGDTFAPGDLLIYNSNYFELDPLNSKAAIWKAGVLLTTAILESTSTLEDSSELSERAARLMGTYSTHKRYITVKFGEEIHDLVKEGEDLEVESILCTIEDAETASADLFDEETRGTLRFLAANTPRSKTRGRVEKIEVFYHGDQDDMSESLQVLSKVSDAKRRRLAKEMGKTFTSGRVDDGMRVEGNPLQPDHAVIIVYITELVTAGVGDKGVFGNQLKTIFGRVMSGVNQSEDGTDIDAIFGYLSIANRIVSSPEVMGTTNTLLKVISTKAADIYFGDN